MPNLNSTAQFKRWQFIAFVFLFAALVVFDQLAKNYSENIFKNYNFAFSIPLPVFLMYVVYGAALFCLAYFVAKNYKKFSVVEKFSFTLIFAGAISNVFERAVSGFVRDFIRINFLDWTGIYNLADFYILIGLAVLFLKKDSSK